MRRTALAESRRNEAVIAYVRAGLLVLVSITEAYWAIAWHGSADSIPLVYRLPVFIATPLAVALAVALRRGWYHPSLAVLAPLADLLIIGARLQATFSLRTQESLATYHDMATVAALAAVFILSGPFRLNWRSALTTIFTGLGLYAWFALQAGVIPGMLAAQLVLLAAVGGIAIGMTVRLLRTVQSELARRTLMRFVPPAVVEGAHEDPLQLLARPRAAIATVLFSDMRGFTSWAEHRPPEEVLAFLNVLQGALADQVHQHGGMVDKFLGDGMLAVFGTTGASGNHARAALDAATGMLDAVARMNREIPEAAELRIGVGIHTGEVVVGILGSGAKMESTILGDTVNTAARLESLTKERGVSLLVSGEAARAIGGERPLTRLGETDIRGRADRLELFGLPDAARPDTPDQVS